MPVLAVRGTPVDGNANGSSKIRELECINQRSLRRKLEGIKRGVSEGSQKAPTRGVSGGSLKEPVIGVAGVTSPKRGILEGWAESIKAVVVGGPVG